MASLSFCVSGLLTDERNIHLSLSEFIVKLKSYCTDNNQFSNNSNGTIQRNDCNNGDGNSIWSNLRLILDYIGGNIESVTSFLINEKKLDNFSKLKKTENKTSSKLLDPMREHYSELLNISFFSISSSCSSILSETDVNNIGNDNNNNNNDNSNDNNRKYYCKKNITIITVDDFTINFPVDQISQRSIISIISLIANQSSFTSQDILKKSKTNYDALQIGRAHV